MLTNDEEHELLTKVRELHAAMLARRASNGGGKPAPRSTQPVPKHDPDDPVVKVTPKGWKGDDMRGRRFSECPPNFLGMLSHVLDSLADKNEEDVDPQKQKYAKWDRANAETARRWRAKLEGSTSGGTMTQQELDEAF